MRISDWSSDVCSSDLQLRDLVIGPDASRLVPFPDDRGIARLCPAPLGMAERRVPAPRIGADDLHAAFGQVERRLGAHAAALVGEMIGAIDRTRSEEHTSELQSLMRISYAVFCLKKKKEIKTPKK